MERDLLQRSNNKIFFAVSSAESLFLNEDLYKNLVKSYIRLISLQDKQICLENLLTYSIISNVSETGDFFCLDNPGCP